MDSLTQIVLGAAVGEALLGNKIGNKALLLGAIAGTIPDLDVFLKLINDSPIFELKTHRSYSHSGVVHIFLAFPFAWLSSKWSKAEISFQRWYWFWFLGFFTHALLDCCTTYGTRLFLPFSKYQVAFNNISVIDPLYTVPFLILLIITMFYRRATVKRKNWFLTAVYVSSAYMLLTFGLKLAVHEKFKNTLQRDQIEFTELNSTPTILNAILWSGIAYNADSLYCAEYSFMRPDVPIKWVGYPRNLSLMQGYQSDALETLEWFSDGNYFMLPKGDSAMQFYTVKFGRTRFDVKNPEEAFMFYTEFRKSENGDITYESRTPANARKGASMKMFFNLLMQRIGIYK